MSVSSLDVRAFGLDSDCWFRKANSQQSSLWTNHFASKRLPIRLATIQIPRPIGMANKT